MPRSAYMKAHVACSICTFCKVCSFTLVSDPALPFILYTLVEIHLPKLLRTPLLVCYRLVDFLLLVQFALYWRIGIAIIASDSVAT